MAKFQTAKKESKENLTIVNFGRFDYKAIRLVKSGNLKIEHKLLADKLIKAKKAVEEVIDFTLSTNQFRVVSDIPKTSMR